ncbi:GDSL-type esterase/lipase family protein [Nocardia sp. NPDC004151]|uniref:GDSL-type esterase/lipase family protein n=1 Tax=Nocardia sp. NPDC004151 TaxID=3364304 RepID=UPI0036A8B2C8
MASRGWGVRNAGVAASVAVVAAMTVGGPGGTAGAETPGCDAPQWVSGWMAAPSDAFGAVDPSMVPQAHVGGQTFRLVATPHLGGSVLRIHLSNQNRPVPVEFAHVTIAEQAAGAAIRGETLREVSFDGSSRVTVPAGGEVVSDPIELTFEAFQPLAVSVYAPGLAVLPTEHFNANATSYYSLPLAGDATDEPSGAALPLPTTSMPFLSGLDVQAPGTTSTIVAFGDSITDGYVGATYLSVPQDPGVVDRNVRYPDFLQRRIDQAGLPFTVVDAGISGNRVTRDGLIPQFGPSGVSRVQRDAIAKAGVTDVIILEGINDLGVPIGVDADQLVAGYTDLIAQLHAAGLAVHLGTIMPAGNALSDGIATLPLAGPVRQRVNAWIRAQTLSDSVIDFDAALRDPADPDVLAPRYAGADNLHPNPAGYQAMAEAIDLSVFRGRCR